MASAHYGDRQPHQTITLRLVANSSAIATSGAACLHMNDISGETRLCANQTNVWQYVSGSWNSGTHTSIVIRLVTDGSPNGPNWFDDISLQ